VGWGGGPRFPLTCFPPPPLSPPPYLHLPLPSPTLQPSVCPSLAPPLLTLPPSTRPSRPLPPGHHPRCVWTRGPSVCVEGGGGSFRPSLPRSLAPSCASSLARLSTSQSVGPSSPSPPLFPRSPLARSLAPPGPPSLVPHPTPGPSLATPSPLLSRHRGFSGDSPPSLCLSCPPYPLRFKQTNHICMDLNMLISYTY
jgi:hypothetical protein